MRDLEKSIPGFYWCSVGGAPLEVCLVSEHTPKTARTIGCPDPFYLNDPNSPLQLLTTTQGDVWPRLKRSDLPEHMGGPKPLPTRGHSWRGPVLDA